MYVQVKFTLPMLVTIYLKQCYVQQTATTTQE